MNLAVADLVPHQGAMCLLDSIESWDERSIVCRADSHRRPNHPLKDKAGLRALCAIEYGAQAISAHVCLVAGTNAGWNCPGVLASVRDVVTSVPRLDQLNQSLTIRADLVLAQGEGRIYDLTVTSGQNRVLTGRLMVMAISAKTGSEMAPFEVSRG